MSGPRDKQFVGDQPPILTREFGKKLGHVFAAEHWVILENCASAIRINKACGWQIPGDQGLAIRVRESGNQGKRRGADTMLQIEVGLDPRAALK